MKNNNNKFIKLVIATSCTIISGCASIVSTSQYPVRVDSSIPGATVSIKDKYGAEVQKITTPAIVTLSSGGGWKSASYMFDFEKEGYESVTETIAADINGWYWGNIVFGGIIGLLLVDPATGAMWKLKDNVSANMYENRNYAKSSSTNALVNKAIPLSNKKDSFSSIAASPQNFSEVSDKLKKLKELKDQGLLTDIEYESKRKMLVEQF